MQELITRAKELLKGFSEENGTKKPDYKAEIPENDMQISFSDIKSDEIAKILKQLDITTLTPIEAMNKLYELQKLL